MSTLSQKIPAEAVKRSTTEEKSKKSSIGAFWSRLTEDQVDKMGRQPGLQSAKRKRGLSDDVEDVDTEILCQQ